MKEDEIMQIAIQAGNTVDREWLKRFAALVAFAEREKFCAVLRQLHDSYSLASDSNNIKARVQA